MDTLNDNVQVSAAAVEFADTILENPVGGVPLPDQDTVRSIVIGAGSPGPAARAYAGKRFDHALAGERAQLKSAMSMLAREHDRLLAAYAVLLGEHNETARNDTEFDDPRSLTGRERLSLVLNGVALMALILASAATIQAVALDTGIATSVAQAIGFGVVPPIGAFALANLVCGLTGVSGYTRAKRAVQIAAIALVPVYIGLFVEVFGAGATEDIGDVLAGLTEVTDGGSGSGDLVGKLFFGVAILFEVLAGAGFKIAIEETLRRRERRAPARSKVLIERESELAARSAELASVEDREHRLAARLAEIDAGRDAYAEEVASLLHGGRASAAHPMPEPNLWTMNRGDAASRNGSVH